MIALDESNDLSGRGGSSDRFEQSHGVEGLVGRTAKRRAGQKGGDEVAVDRLVGGRQGDLAPGTVGSFFLKMLVGGMQPARPRRSTSAQSRPPGEMPETASETGVPSASRIAAAVTRSIPGSR